MRKMPLGKIPGNLALGWEENTDHDDQAAPNSGKLSVPVDKPAQHQLTCVATATSTGDMGPSRKPARLPAGTQRLQHGGHDGYAERGD